MKNSNGSCRRRQWAVLLGVLAVVPLLTGISYDISGLDHLEPSVRAAISQAYNDILRRENELNSLMQKIEAMDESIAASLERGEQGNRSLQTTMKKFDRMTDFIVHGSGDYSGAGEYCSKVPELGQEFDASARSVEETSEHAAHLIRNAGDWPTSQTILRDACVKVNVLQEQYDHHLQVKHELWSTLAYIKGHMEGRDSHVKIGSGVAAGQIAEVMKSENEASRNGAALEGLVRAFNAELLAFEQVVDELPFSEQVPAGLENEMKASLKSFQAFHYRWIRIEKDEKGKTIEVAVQRAEEASAGVSALKKKRTEAELQIESALQDVAQAFEACRSLRPGPMAFIQQVEQVGQKTKTAVYEVAGAHEARKLKLHERKQELVLVKAKAEAVIEESREEVKHYQFEIAKREVLLEKRLSSSDRNKLEAQIKHGRELVEDHEARIRQAKINIEKIDELSRNDQEDDQFTNVQCVPAVDEIRAGGDGDTESTVPKMTLMGVGT